MKEGEAQQPLLQHYLYFYQVVFTFAEYIFCIIQLCMIEINKVLFVDQNGKAVKIISDIPCQRLLFQRQLELGAASADTHRKADI